MSFRFKTIIGIAIIQAVLLLILILFGINTLKSSIDEEFLKRANTSATLFASTTQNAVLAADLAALESFVSDVLTNPDMVYARVIGKEVVLTEGGDNSALSRPFVLDTHLENVKDGVFDVYADINIANERYGRVELGFSIKTIEKVLAKARNQIIIYAVLAMTLVVLFSYMLGSYLTHGLSALKTASWNIAKGNFGYQTKVHGRDELAQTASAFNDMSNRLALLDENHRKAENEIKNLNVELEKRVELRTAQLALLNKELEYQSLHDALTHLPNRTLYYDRLDQAILLARRNKHSFALMILDLDRFKQINDTLGHHAGDMLLKETSSRLKLALRQSDTVARMGGDEFALLLPTAFTEQNVTVVAQKIIQVLKAPLIVDGKSIEIAASIGIAIFPKHGEDAFSLLRCSDAAMYFAKRNQSGYAVYNSSLDAEDSERLSLHTDLLRAIDNKELVLHYQPKIDFVSQRISGVEALARWQHPRFGLLFPDTFIPIAEKAGFMKPFTLAVMDLALTQSAIWSQSGLHLKLAINIAASNLQDPKFPEDVSAILRQHNVLPADIELEITETAIMSEPLKTIENIKKLSGMGLQIAIDDFGTGYSSMAYLQKLLVAKIKIDKSFVIGMHNNENDEIIVQSTVNLGHNLGFTVVAEGVETQAAWDKLKELGCDSAQGFLMGRPVPPAELEEWLKHSPWGLSGGDVSGT